uniref:Uncharacterized protein n=1 Tax=Anopheles maculatus TaxID=74869 RepID=A0A182SAI2_9DIPT
MPKVAEVALLLSRCFSPGGLFDGATEDAELAFQYAVEAVNNEKLSYSNYQLEAQAVQVKYGDQFDVSKKLCRLLKVSVYRSCTSSSKQNKQADSRFKKVGMRGYSK